VPLFGGGHQEKGLRPGTENVLGVIGQGEAARLAREEASGAAADVAARRDRLEAGAKALGARVNGDPAARVGNTSNLAWDGVSGEVLVIALDLEGVSASTGAACTSGSVEPSPVLLALGQPRAQAACGVRLSLGRDNRDDEVERVLALLPGLVARIRAAGPV
jgi:cysteine desulfurase